jgi:hypothetical protein
MTDAVSFKNSTVFFAPFWVDNYEKFLCDAKKDERYSERENKELLSYLLPYVNSIYTDPSLFCSFELKSEHLKDIYMLNDCISLPEPPILEGLRVSCFSTGCGFFEMTVNYGGAPLGCIEDFAYRFKNASFVDSKNGHSNDLFSCLSTLLPSPADLFFTASSFKKECKMFHRILLPEGVNEAELVTHLAKLRRGYHNNFPLPADDSDYDMLYRPYRHDCWAGSQEGIASVTYLSDDESSNNYVKKHKFSQLDANYRFLYLLLLNQRFSSMKYIECISALNKSKAKNKGKMLTDLSQRITKLKTVFAFNVISDDLIYQNVYKRMYSILDIDRLLDDIRDNEEQEQLINNAKSLQAEKQTEAFLLMLSILSLASVLIDSSSYLDRLKIGESISTIISLILVVLVVIVYVIQHKRNK